MYLLDTNVLIEAARPQPQPRVRRWLASVPADALILCPIVVAEYLVGVHQLEEEPRERALAFLRACRAGWAWADVDFSAGAAWALRRATYPGKPRANDLWIAAIALANGLTVATRNVRDFQRHQVPVFNPFATS